MTQAFQTAVNLYRQRQFATAERELRSILRADPRHADALQLAGLLAMQRGGAAEALEFWRRSLAVNPHQPAVFLNMGSAELNLGRPQAALECCEAALALRPGYADALTNRARALRELARPDDALDSYHEAVRLRPDHPPIRTERAHLLMEMSRPLDALIDYEYVCQATPQDSLAQFNRGLALEMARQFDAAVAAFDAVLARAPDFAQGHQHRGNALRALGHHTEAFDSYSRALAARGGAQVQVNALCGAGAALRELGRLQESLAYYERALSLDAQHLDALSNRGRVLLALRKPAEAVESLERALQVAPEAAQRHNHALGHLLHAQLCCCDWRDYEGTVRRLTDAVLRGERVTLPSLCLVSSDVSHVQLACARTFVADNWDALETALVSSHDDVPAKVRVAYVSADFRQHPVASLLVNLIETHDRERFEILGVSLRPPDGSPLGERIRAAFDRLIDITGMSDAAAAELLRGLNIDIALDLNGYTDGFRAGLFARRIAPVQINFLGYTGTLGAPYIDYVIADPVAIPAGDREYFTESVACLPGCYLPVDGRRPPVTPMDRLQAGLPARGFVFCCFNNHYKLNPRMFDVWMRMLLAVEGSVLWLAGAGRPVVSNLRAEAARRGVAPERLLFAPRLPDPNAHLARIAAADLFLDTMPFNAHATAVDALWAGLPVLTCRGTTFAGRVCASLVTSAGLPQMVTDNLAAYESLGISLAQSAEAMRSIRGQLVALRSTAPLYDHAKYRLHLETAYRAMIRQVQRGMPPRALDV